MIGRGVVVLAAAAFYEWLVVEAILSEAIAAIVVGLLTVVVVERMLAVSSIRGRVSLGFLRPFVARVIPGTFRESYDLLVPTLWRTMVRREHVTGRWIALRYDADDMSVEREHARRSIVIFGSNLTPNALPLDLDPATGRLILHQLVRRREDAAGDPRYPM